MSLDLWLEIDTGGAEPTILDECHWNITHNLISMADECGLYDVLWRADEDFETAGDMIKPIEEGLAILKGDREGFEKFNPKNGWGDYDGLVRFAERVLAGCMAHPSAKPGTSR